MGLGLRGSCHWPKDFSELIRLRSLPGVFLAHQFPNEAKRKRKNCIGKDGKPGREYLLENKKEKRKDFPDIFLKGPSLFLSFLKKPLSSGLRISSLNWEMLHENHKRQSKVVFFNRESCFDFFPCFFSNF